jgi:hypothetical protein
MRRVAAAVAFAAISAAAWPASAGAAKCWIDNGAVVVPALAGNIAGEFILDLSAPHSQLHDTSAQSHGLGDAIELQAPVSLAGEHIPAKLAILDLDDRGWGFATGIDGVIGADLLSGYVVDLSSSPCRLTLSRRAAPASHPVATLPLTVVGGVPTIAASISDGRKTRRGHFAIDTGAAGIRLSADAARFSRLSARVDPMSRSQPPARLATLSFGGQTYRDQPAGLQIGAPEGVLGGIGDEIWSRYELRIDLRRGRLLLFAPAAAGVSAPRSARSGGS